MSPSPPRLRRPERAEANATLLEMRERQIVAVTPPFETGMLMRLREPTVSFYRYLLETAGRGRMWTERRALGDPELEALLADEGIEVTVLSIGGVPAGFFELDARTPGAVILAGIGLIPEFTGRGLGRYLLAAAVDGAWTHDPEVVRTETTDLDDPRALLLLQWAGFRPVGTARRPVVG
jgi:GNAT superfamily N-acetyltransferase